MNHRRILVGAATLVAALAVGAGTASAAKVVNGNFERGDLSGWKTTYYPAPKAPLGEWLVYGEIMRPETRRGGLPLPQGQFGAISAQDGASGQILSQVVDLKPGKKHKLRFKLAYLNENETGFITPRTLGIGRTNQQFRMDVIEPDAPIKSVKDKHVLERVYRTERGDPDASDFRTITANLTPYAGEKVRLRFAVAVTEEELNAAVDSVKVKTKPAG